MPFSIRLDSDTEAKIRRLSAATGRSKSAVVREAVSRYEPDQEAADPPLAESAFGRLQAFAGVVRTGGNYSRDTHAKYRTVLRRKAHGRRSH